MAVLLHKFVSTARSLRSPYMATCRTLTKIQDEEFTMEYLEGDKKGIAVCSLTRPKAKNAFGKNLKNQMTIAMEMLKFEKDLRVMVLRSAVPGIFSAGADLKERATMPQSEVGPFVASGRLLGLELSDLPIPTIAALDGAALGGGLELALCCDIRVAANTAKMGLVETKLAIIPGGGGTQRLSRLVGPAIAKELIFTGRAVDGSEALSLGIVNYVVDQNAAGDAAYLKAMKVAEQIAANGPIALRMAKLAVNRGIEVDLSTGLAFEQAYHAQVIPTKDRVEGIRAFIEKRPAQFKGE